MLCDLHIHSGYSSGTQTLDEIADEALIVALMPDHPELSVQDYRAHRKVRGEGGFKHSSYLRSKGLPGDYEGAVRLMMPYRDELVAAYMKQEFAPLEETIDATHAAGGKAVLPGGYLPDAESLRGEIDGLCAMGLDGLEVESLNYEEEMTQLAGTLAEERGLLMTGGGDGHGSWTDPDKLFIQGYPLEGLNLGDIKIVPPSRPGFDDGLDR